jgi:manganese/zinc/iron transport system substrate-binding protein
MGMIPRGASVSGMCAVVVAAFVAIAAIATAGSSANAAEPLNVVTTTSMIGDAARQVGGDRVVVTALMEPGVDPHSYRQTRTDIARLVRADLVLWHGLYLEAQMEEFLLDLGERRAVVPVGEAVPEDLRLGNATYAGRYDPHVWMDPDLWTDVVRAVRDALIAVDPDGAAEYRENADRHIAEVGDLATYVKRIIASVPPQKRVLVTAHDAFSYFGRANDFEVLGIQGISTESDAGLRRIESLVDEIVARGIGAVFVESSVPDRNVRAVIEGAAARGHHVIVGGELFSDAMGQEGTYEGTYLGMIDHNVTTIARALGGDADAFGMSGRLSVGG